MTQIAANGTSRPQPKTLTVVRAVGYVTFREIIRDKVLYNIILCAFLLFGIGFLASRLMLGHQERVVLDFGLSAVGISCAMIAVFTGAGLLGKEYERRTVFVALSRPISRLQFILGKFAGLVAVVGLNWFLLSASFMLILWGTSGSSDFVFNGAIYWALILLFFQSVLLSSLSILCSSLSTTSLAAIMTTGFYLIGNNITQIRLVAGRMRSPFFSGLLNSVATILPNLEHFNLGTRVTYSLPISWAFGFTGIAYALVIATMFLFGAGLLLRLREG